MRRQVFISTCAAAVASVAAVTVNQSRNNRTEWRKQQKRHHRAALYHPLKPSKTAWRQLLSSGTASDVIVSINFDQNTFFLVLLPLFTKQRYTINSSSPYGTGLQRRERNTWIKSLDLSGLALRYLKSNCRQYALFPILDMVATSVTVWVDYSIGVLYNMCVKKKDTVLQVSWATREKSK